MKSISSIKIQNFLEENKVFPNYVIGEVAYYKRTKRFKEVFDLYTIRYYCIPNKKI